jgi:hypothetical protein
VRTTTNAGVALSFLACEEAKNATGSLHSERRLSTWPSLRSYDYVLAWRGTAHGEVVFINLLPGNEVQVHRSQRAVRIADLAQTPKVERHREQVREALLARGYKESTPRDAEGFEMWERSALVQSGLAGRPSRERLTGVARVRLPRR